MSVGISGLTGNPYFDAPMKGGTFTTYNPAQDTNKGSLESYIQMATNQANEARAANLKRYDEMMGIYNQIAETYSPTGTFGAGYKAELEATKKRDVSSGIAQTIESGLYGTSIPSTIGTKWEETVGAPARLKLEDIRTERYASALGQKAGAIERREDTYPDYSQIAQLLMQASQTTKAQPSYNSWMTGIGGT